MTRVWLCTCSSTAFVKLSVARTKHRIWCLAAAAVAVPGQVVPGPFCSCHLSSPLTAQTRWQCAGCCPRAELCPGPRPSPAWEDEPSREPGLCQEHGQGEEEGVTVAQLSAVSWPFPAAWNRQSTQPRGSGREHSTECFQHTGDICPAGPGNVFSCSISVHVLSAFPACSPPSQACLSQMVQQKPCNCISSSLAPVVIQIIK